MLKEARHLLNQAALLTDIPLSLSTPQRDVDKLRIVWGDPYE